MARYRKAAAVGEEPIPGSGRLGTLQIRGYFWPWPEEPVCTAKAAVPVPAHQSEQPRSRRYRILSPAVRGCTIFSAAVGKRFHNKCSRPLTPLLPHMSVVVVDQRIFPHPCLCNLLVDEFEFAKVTGNHCLHLAVVKAY